MIYAYKNAIICIHQLINNKRKENFENTQSTYVENTKHNHWLYFLVSAVEVTDSIAALHTTVQGKPMSADYQLMSMRLPSVGVWE